MPCVASCPSACSVPRLDLLRGELAEAASDGTWQERDSRLAKLRVEEKQVQQALYRQSLRLEEHEDPEHPVVKLATQRIEELSGQVEAIAATIVELERPDPRSHAPRKSKRSWPASLTCARPWHRPTARS
jgi:hypothetical protein